MLAVVREKTNRSEERATRDVEQLSRDQTRKNAYLAKEQAIVEANKARMLKSKKQPRE